MAAAQLSPQNGAVVTPAGQATDFGSFEITESQATESVAAYGAAVYDPYRGSGTPHQKVSVGGFARAHGTGTALLGIQTATGGTATYTIDTGVTVGGNYVLSQVKISHARVRAAIPITMDLDNANDPTTTWPTT